MRSRWYVLCNAVAVVMLAPVAPVAAFTMTQIGSAAGGNPGDLCEALGGTTCQPYFEVSGLVAGDAFELGWTLDGSEILGPDGIPDFPTLRAEASLTVTSITSTQVVLDIILDNQTDPLQNVAGLVAPIVSFGMELDGFGSGLLSGAGTSLDTYATNNIAGGPGLTVDFCASTDPACNSGSQADAIGIGGTDSFQFTLSGSFDPGRGITLSNFATKWQTNYDALVTPDDPAVTSGNSSLEQPGLPGNPTPEPGTALLLGAGLIGLAANNRRKKRS
jgi:hypothetical protein